MAKHYSNTPDQVRRLEQLWGGGWEKEAIGSEISTQNVGRPNIFLKLFSPSNFLKFIILRFFYFVGG